MGVVYLGILLCAIAFAIAVVYICLVLKRTSDVLNSLGKTFGKVEKELTHITPQVKETIRGTDKIVDDLGTKLKSTDSLFDSLEELGLSAQSFNLAYQQKRATMSDPELQEEIRPFVEGIKWAEAGSQLYSKWTKTKPVKNELMPQNSYELKVQGRDTTRLPAAKTGKGDRP
ncbi:DUF948 domain-containing protein [Virgibacillus xinjiangensis]|uniref:DUF948 domain-containing protein n=1 Tax=Virgibacillus xinjiangensis TaxID=393090 RepID=A0ABV7CXJ7_9BACI